MVAPNLHVPLPKSAPPTVLYYEENGKIILTTEEKIFSGSYGLDAVLVRLEQLLTTPKNKINTIVINVATCIRNAMDKDLSDSDNIRKIEIEIGYMVDTLTNFFQRSSIKTPYILFYLNDYITQLPAEHIRPPTAGKLLYFELIHEFWHKIAKLGISKSENVTVNFIRLTPGKYAEQLYTNIQKISKIVPSASYTGYYALLSHQPLDFHLLNLAPNGILVASHTGEVMTNKMLSQKVFNDPDVPFNEVTHMILGDKYQLKPMVKIGTRRKVLDMAKNHKWRIRTLEQIKKDVRSLGIIIE